MKTTTLDLEVSKFIASLQALGTHKERVKLCVTKRLELIQHHTIKTVRKYLTFYRTALKTAFGANTSLLTNLKTPKAANDKINLDYKNEIQKRTETHALIEITDYKGMIELAHGLISLDNESYYKCVLGLCLLTGRRSTEILKTGVFAPTRNKYTLHFEGQLKTKGIEKSYTIPTLVPAKDILNAVTWLRSKKDFTQHTEKEINTLTSKDLGVYTKRLFKDFLGFDIAPHDLRKAYAAIAYKNYTDNGGTDGFRVWGAKALGHSEEKTTETYYKYTIVENPLS